MEEKDVLIKVEGLSKKFSKDLKTGLKYGVKDLFSNVFGSKKTKSELRPSEFWSLKDINFELRRGECLGLIGHNGAGKSTLLKILNGLINPDEGKVTIHGRVSALIELGAGFNPILTGRENIYNNGAVLGFTKAEIDAKVDEIIDFAELREFIDMPVQNYSSGMQVRLGFAVAAQMEPDVLIVDEVLAVGDMGFVLKCFKIIDTILPNTAIVFVSHSMPMISRICNDVILLDKGKSKFQGKSVAKGIDMYYGKFVNNGKSVIYSDNSIEFVNASFLKQKADVVNGNDIFELNWNSDFEFQINLKNISLEFTPFITLSIYDKEQRGVALFNYNFTNSKLEKGVFNVTLKHKKLQLSKGVYSLNLIIYETEKLTNPILRVNNIFSFQIIAKKDTWPPFLLNSDLSITT
ncbi:MAG: lipopolysaccharide transport system ATP-binding protein [Flavobacteriaceae bacterium]|jgi:lipopolysaccharide transport system ATP-binding protein